MKSAIIAKVAAQASDLYREAHKACEVSNVKQQLEKVYKTSLIKQHTFHAGIGKEERMLGHFL